ncbi:MAG: murein biosynthesis integral membrane protein MurJ [Candidatus Eremiobacteraeota bacterium]|nr:murein biosynthesis integral membrane protein MurJ [Candidatus Eremiobacteraeota bacterium]
MAATFASTLFGFFREVVNAKYYGTQWEMDTFLAAATIPTILFGVFNGALVSALVPVFSEYLSRHAFEDAARLASTVANVLFITLSVLAALGWLLAPAFVPLVAHGFPAPQMGVAIHMTRWLMPSLVATSLAGVTSAILNANHRFHSSALSGIAINLTTIATVLLLFGKLGIFALVFGTSLGLVAQLLVQMPSIIRLRIWRPVIDLRHPGLRRIAAMLGPIVVGSAAGQVALFFDRYFASTLSPGYMAGMNYATKLVGFPQQIFAAAIATVIFPLLAAQFANQNRLSVRQSVVMGLRMVNFITIPSVCALFVLAAPIVQGLFERGAFQASATQLCAGLLPYAAVGLIALAANVVLTRVCFACHETAAAVVISIISVVINVALSLAWLSTLGARGLLLANSVSQSIQAVLLFLLVWRLLGGLEWKVIARSAVSITVCSLVMVATLHWIASLGAPPPATFAARSWFLVGQIGIAALVFLAATQLVGVEEPGIALRLIMKKFEGSVPAPPEGRDVPIA